MASFALRAIAAACVARAPPRGVLQGRAELEPRVQLCATRGTNVTRAPAIHPSDTSLTSHRMIACVQKRGTDPGEHQCVQS